MRSRSWRLRAISSAREAMRSFSTETRIVSCSAPRPAPPACASSSRTSPARPARTSMLAARRISIASSPRPSRCSEKDHARTRPQRAAHPRSRARGGCAARSWRPPPRRQARARQRERIGSHGFDDAVPVRVLRKGATMSWLVTMPIGALRRRPRRAIDALGAHQRRRLGHGDPRRAGERQALHQQAQQAGRRPAAPRRCAAQGARWIAPSLIAQARVVRLRGRVPGAASRCRAPRAAAGAGRSPPPAARRRARCARPITCTPSRSAIVSRR